MFNISICILKLKTIGITSYFIILLNQMSEVYINKKLYFMYIHWYILEWILTMKSTCFSSLFCGKNNTTYIKLKTIILLKEDGLTHELDTKGEGSTTHRDSSEQTFDANHESVFRNCLSFSMCPVLYSFWFLGIFWIIPYFKTRVFPKVEKYYFTIYRGIKWGIFLIF